MQRWQILQCITVIGISCVFVCVTYNSRSVFYRLVLILRAVYHVRIKRGYTVKEKKKYIYNNILCKVSKKKKKQACSFLFGKPQNTSLRTCINKIPQERMLEFL